MQGTTMKVKTHENTRRVRAQELQKAHSMPQHTGVKPKLVWTIIQTLTLGELRHNTEQKVPS